MFLTLSAICVAALCLLIASQIKRARDQSEMEQHSITPEALHQSCSLPAQNRLQLRRRAANSSNEGLTPFQLYRFSVHDNHASTNAVGGTKGGQQ
jgi:hypothetical protein